MSKIICFGLLSLLAVSTMARKPAVEPVMGISIEEYKEVDPKEAKGYDFSTSQSKESSSTSSSENSPANLQVQSLSDNSTQETNILFVFLMLLPVIASAFAFFKISKKDPENVINLDELRNRKSQSKDSDDDIPKAS